MHKRRIYRRLRTGGLCSHVPSPTASLGLDSAVSVHRLAPLAFRLAPNHASRHRPCLRLVVILAHDESKSVLPQRTFTPQVRAHAGRTPLARADPLRRPSGPAWCARPCCTTQDLTSTVSGRLARTLGVKEHALLGPTTKNSQPRHRASKADCYPCTVNISEILRLLQQDGWMLVATRGSHRQYKHASKPG